MVELYTVVVFIVGVLVGVVLGLAGGLLIDREARRDCGGWRP